MPSHPGTSSTPATATAPSHATGSGVTSPVVRRIRPGDAAWMRALRLEMLADSPLAFLETVAEHAARSHSEYAARVARASAGPDLAQFVAEWGGRFVGHLGAAVHPGDPAVTLLFAIYLTPAWRGRPRQDPGRLATGSAPLRPPAAGGGGLLAELVEEAAAWSRAVGRSELMLEVMVGNDRAIRAYQRLGFTDAGVRVPHPKIAELTEMQMRRPV